MPKNCELTPRKKSVIVALDKEGLSSRAIAVRIDFCYSTVARLLQKYRKNGNLDRVKGRGGKGFLV